MSTPARPDPAARGSGPRSISASAVGEYVYCARAYGLSRATAGAADPLAAACVAQGMPPDWRSEAAREFAWRGGRRAARLDAGRRAHHQHERSIRLTVWLALLGLLLILAAVVAGLPMLLQYLLPR
jgi:hypothetical protein